MEEPPRSPQVLRSMTRVIMTVGNALVVMVVGATTGPIGEADPRDLWRGSIAHPTTCMHTQIVSLIGESEQATLDSTAHTATGRAQWHVVQVWTTARG